MSADRVYLFNAPDDAKHVATAEAACRHSVEASRLLTLALRGLLSEETNILDGDEMLLTDLSEHAQMWAGKAVDLLAGEPAVHPPLGEPVTHGKRVADCPVCGAAILKGGQSFTCDRCDVEMHTDCFFGRVATLAEWQEYMRQSHAGPDDYVPDVVCAQCRAKGKPA